MNPQPLKATQIRTRRLASLNGQEQVKVTCTSRNPFNLPTQTRFQIFGQRNPVITRITPATVLKTHSAFPVFVPHAALPDHQAARVPGQKRPPCRHSVQSSRCSPLGSLAQAPEGIS
jgi:hypothetical protein